jgi:hypothetical protein
VASLKLKIVLVGVPSDFSITIRALLDQADLVEKTSVAENPSQATELLTAGEANSLFLAPTAFDWVSTKELLHLCSMTLPVCLVGPASELLTLNGIPKDWQERLRDYFYLQSDVAFPELQEQLAYAVRGLHRYLLKQLIRANVGQIATQAAQSGASPELAEKALQASRALSEVEALDKSELGRVLGLNPAQMRTLFDEALGHARKAAWRSQVANFTALGTGLLLIIVTALLALIRSTADVWTFATGGMGAAATIAALVTSPSRRIGSGASQLIYVQMAYFSFLTQVRILNAPGPETAVQRSERLEGATAKLLEQLKALPGDN